MALRRNVTLLAAMPRRLAPFADSNFIRWARTVAPAAKHVGATRFDRPEPTSLSSKRIDAGPPPNMSIDIRDPDLAEFVEDRLSVPQSLPAPAVGCRWAWVEAMRTAALVPDGWFSWVGDGEMFGMAMSRICVCPEEARPTAAAPHAVGLSVTRFSSAFTQSVVKAEPEHLAQFLISMHIKRAAPPSETPPAPPGAGGLQEAADAMVDALHPDAGSDSNAAAVAGHESAPSGLLPVVIDSWKHEVTAGLTMWGMEYTIAHSDVANKARAAHGMHYYVAIVLNAREDMAFEVEFRAPCKEWPHWWRGYGELLTDELFLNWVESSPAKFQ